MGRRIAIEWSEAETPEYLRKLYRSKKNARNRERLHAIWLLRRGWTATQAADALGVNYQTVSSWALKFSKGGVKELLSR